MGVEGGFFFKINKRASTFIREMRVPTFVGFHSLKLHWLCSKQDTYSSPFIGFDVGPPPSPYQETSFMALVYGWPLTSLLTSLKVITSLKLITSSSPSSKLS